MNTNKANKNNNTLVNEIMALGQSVGYKAVRAKYYAMGSEDFNPMKNHALVEDCQSASILAIYEEIVRLELDTLEGVDNDTMREIIRIGYRACNEYTNGLQRDIKKHMWIEARDNDGEIIAEQFEDVTRDVQRMTIDREDIRAGLEELTPLETRVFKYMALGYLDETIARRIYGKNTTQARTNVRKIKMKIRAKMSQYVDR